MGDKQDVYPIEIFSLTSLKYVFFPSWKEKLTELGNET